MAKYKRHAQGGRFKAANFGDLGLRAYREQQDRQIRHLKEQNQQDQAYSKQHLQRLEGNAAKEIQHNRELQNFYNKRDQLAIDNTQIRGKREVEALMGEAKEYEKQAKFWKDFSTTYSQQYLEAAGDIYDIATTHQSNQQMQALYHDKDHQKFSQGASKLNNLADHEGLKIQNKAWEDYNKGKISEAELNDIVGHVSEISLRINKKTKKALLQKELDEIDQEERHLKALAVEKGIEWTAETASQLMFLRKMELMRAYGVDPGSEIGRNFLDGWAKKEYDITKPLKEIAEANGYMKTGGELNEQTENLIAPVQFLNSKPADKKKGLITATGNNFIDYNSSLQARVNHEAFTSRINSEGQVVKGTNNRHHAFIQIMESDIESGRFVSKEQARNHTILQPHPDADRHFHDDGKTMTYPTKQTWLGRYGDSMDADGKTLEDKFDDAWEAYEKKTSEKFKNDIAIRDNNALASIDKQARSGELDLSDPSKITQLKKTYAGLPKTIDKLTDYEVFAAENKNLGVVTSNLTDLHKAGDLKNLTEYLQYLPPEMQEAWADKVKQLEVLDRMGYTGTDLTTKAKEILRGILGAEATKPGALGTAHYGRTVEAIKQDILKTFDEVYETAGETDLEKIDALNDRIDKKVADNKGIYRRDNSGLSTRFLFDVDEEDRNPTVTTQEIDNKLSGGAQGLENLFTGMTEGSVQVQDGGIETSKTLIPIDDADRAIRHLNAGIPIKKNNIVEHIFHRQPLVDNKKQYTRRDIWNKYFESIGVDTVIPPGSIEKANSTIKQSPLKVTRPLSEANNETVGAVASLVEDKVIDLNEPSMESIKINEEKKVRLSVLDRLHQSGIIDLSAYGY